MEDSWALKIGECVLSSKLKLNENWSYENGVVLKALIKLYEQYKDSRYLEFCKKNINSFINTDYSIRDLDLKKHDLDNYNNAKVIVDLYKITADEKYKKVILNFYENLKQHPKTSDGAFSYKERYKNQVWLEGVYMAEPFYAECIKLFENRTKFDEVIRHFLLSYKYLKNKENGLLYHAWDENKKMFWADKEKGTSSSFWGRAMGYYAMALVDCLEVLEDKVYEAKYLRDIVKNISEAIMNVQDEESGCWYQILDCPQRKGNYLEVSVSCMFLYFLASAYRKGIISGDKVNKAIFNAYNGIIDEFITITNDCSININKACFGASLGDKQDQDGSFNYYISEPIIANNLSSVGMFILAMNEYDNIKRKLRK